MAPIISWRRLVGLCFLSTTVILWTASGFLASSIFADATYSKPFFVTYINTAFFVLLLLPFAVRRWGLKIGRVKPAISYAPLSGTDDQADEPLGNEADSRDRPSFEADLRSSPPTNPSVHEQDTPLTDRQTFNLAFAFGILWFASNYFSSGSLQYTTVASSTVLSSTSSVFTLLIGAYFRVEKITLRKAIAVLGCLLGVMLISKAESDAKWGDKNRGSFPYKSPWELAAGDAMALIAAIMYGIYSVALAKKVGNETRMSMPLFFGFIGLVGTFCLWPGFIVLHFSGVERFALPANGRVWGVVIFNAVASLVSDACWGYAVLYLSPLVVTVGLSLTIPLALLGQVVFSSQWASPLYFVGAMIVLVSFIFINYQSGPDTQQQQQQQQQQPVEPDTE